MIQTHWRQSNKNLKESRSLSQQLLWTFKSKMIADCLAANPRNQALTSQAQSSKWYRLNLWILWTFKSKRLSNLTSLNPITSLHLRPTTLKDSTLLTTQEPKDLEESSNLLAKCLNRWHKSQPVTSLKPTEALKDLPRRAPPNLLTGLW